MAAPIASTCFEGCSDQTRRLSKGYLIVAPASTLAHAASGKAVVNKPQGGMCCRPDKAHLEHHSLVRNMLSSPVPKVCCLFAAMSRGAWSFTSICRVFCAMRFFTACSSCSYARGKCWKVFKIISQHASSCHDRCKILCQKVLHQGTKLSSESRNRTNKTTIRVKNMRTR